MYVTSPATHAAAPLGWVPPVLREREFDRIRDLLFQSAGISLSDAKKALVSSRLEGRLRQLALTSYESYLDRVLAPESEERQVMLDLLTTNETHFFREPRHFDFLASHILPSIGHSGMKVWSAACSTGEEVYSLAMTLDTHFGTAREWRVFGADISRRVLEVARHGVYPMASAQEIPPDYLGRYCLKGVRSRQGTFAIDPDLQRRTELFHMNLNGAWPEMDKFHVVFLRNVMIYFDAETRRKLIDRFRRQLVPGGFLVVGHAESMMVNNPGFTCLRPSIYQAR